MSVIKKNRWAISFAIVLIACFALLEERAVQRANALPAETYEDLETFANVLSIVQKNYVEPVTTKRLIDGAITGMLAALDPHSAYLTPDAYRDLQVDTRGSFGGLGIEITVRNGMLTIVAPIDDTPADRAGLKSGDEIVKIDNDFTKDMTLSDAVKRMRGPKGSKVSLTIHRDGVPDLFSVAVTRAVIRIQSVKAKGAGRRLRLPPGQHFPGKYRRRCRARARHFQQAGSRQNQGRGARSARRSGWSAQSGGESGR